jgi:hypothetical protein
VLDAVQFVNQSDIRKNKNMRDSLFDMAGCIEISTTQFDSTFLAMCVIAFAVHVGNFFINYKTVSVVPRH